MNIKDQLFASELERKIIEHSDNVRELKGIRKPGNLESLLGQIIESKRRIDYVLALNEKEMSYERADPKSTMFDPIQAAVIMRKDNDINEACWLTFLAIHFGKHLKSKWMLAKCVYGGFGSDHVWSWLNVTSKTDDFILWLADNHKRLGAHGAFGNHRKYESLNPIKKNWNGAIIQSYIDWVTQFGDHVALIEKYKNEYCDSKERFNALYKSMNQVIRFGRTAKFDFLTMLGKLHIMDIEADSTYMSEATGPKRGANLLFGGTTLNCYSSEVLEKWISELDMDINVGMQVIEDSLCNWQKSPNVFVKFRG
jgi:hypothetical protein